MDAIADKAATVSEADHEQIQSDANLKLWRHNEMTDPAHTKPVSIGSRGFTSIDGYYQIKRATETFGPLGMGWGWDAEDEAVEGTTSKGENVIVAKVKLTLWYIPPGAKNGNGKRAFCGPVVGCNQLLSAKGHVDDEAFKKATTDAITKALSYLGFSADVFMGLYDDNKYVNRLKAEFSAKAAVAKAKLPEICVRSVELLPKVMDLGELNVSWRAMRDELNKLPPAQLDYMKARFAMRKRQLAPGAEQELDENNLPPPEDMGGRHGDDPGASG